MSLHRRPIAFTHSAESTICTGKPKPSSLISSNAPYLVRRPSGKGQEDARRPDQTVLYPSSGWSLSETSWVLGWKVSANLLIARAHQQTHQSSLTNSTAPIPSRKQQLPHEAEEFQLSILAHSLMV
jgi:hypothetical protein